MTASGAAQPPRGIGPRTRPCRWERDCRSTTVDGSARVTINDRGPYVAGYNIDLSRAATREVGLAKPGTTPVRVTPL
jgi:hypothetical protein